MLYASIALNMFPRQQLENTLTYITDVAGRPCVITKQEWQLMCKEDQVSARPRQLSPLALAELSLTGNQFLLNQKICHLYHRPICSGDTAVRSTAASVTSCLFSHSPLPQK